MTTHDEMPVEPKCLQKDYGLSSCRDRICQDARDYIDALRRYAEGLRDKRIGIDEDTLAHRLEAEWPLEIALMVGKTYGRFGRNLKAARAARKEGKS